MSDQQEQCNHAPHMLKKLGVGDFPYECSGCGHKFTLLLAATESKAETSAMKVPPSDPGLAALLEADKSRVITNEEKQVRRESWVRGEMGLDRKDSKAEGEQKPPTLTPEHFLNKFPHDPLSAIRQYGDYRARDLIAFLSNTGKRVPSITSERIAEIANEPTPCSTYVSETKYRIEKALREAGVRVGK